MNAAITEAEALLGDAADHMTAANVTAVLGGLHALAGAAEEADALLERSRELYEDIGATRALLTVWSPQRIAADTLAGNLDAATILAEAVVAELMSANDRAYASTHAVFLADLLLLRGTDAQAERYWRSPSSTRCRPTSSSDSCSGPSAPGCRPGPASSPPRRRAGTGRYRPVVDDGRAPRPRPGPPGAGGGVVAHGKASGRPGASRRSLPAPAPERRGGALVGAPSP